MDLERLKETAQAMVAEGKGLLAADESTGTITKRLEAAGLESTADSRRDYRELLLSTPGISEFISGVILYDETIRQNAADGTPFPDMVRSHGVIPGIKVDTGAKPLALSPEETVTEGLDGLRERVAEYVGMGARFAKWRAVIRIGDGIPTDTCVATNAHALARYAALCQEGGLVPIVEPEVLLEGDHGIERCFEVTERTLRAVFAELALQRVALEGMVLKPNMVLAGKDAPDPSGVEEVATETVRCLRRVVPAAVPGVMFLSGGQTPEQSTAHLDAMNRMGAQPWVVTFSYARALQDAPLRIWDGTPATVEQAQGAFHARTRLVSLASRGQYSPDMESEAA